MADGYLMGYVKKGLVVIVGNYGSGKTEVAINLAVNQNEAGLTVRMADLDLVNPYFRTREARQMLAKQGIDLVLPHGTYMHADLPILTREVAGLIGAPGPLTILDVGGDHVGARVLAALSEAFKRSTFELLQVVNPYRPKTDTIDGCLLMKGEIENAAGLKVSGWIGNANLMDETNPETIYAGYRLMTKLSLKSDLPLRFVTAPANLMDQLDVSVFDCPVLAIRRQLMPPWRKAIR